MPTVAEERSGWERWNAATSAIAPDFVTRPSGQVGAFRGRIIHHNALGLAYSSIETNARSTHRGPDTASRPDRHHCLILQIRGRSTVRQGSRTTILGPSDMALLSPVDDCEIVNSGAIRQLSFYVPEAILFDQIGSTDLPGAVSIPSASAVGSLLSTLLTHIHSRSTELGALEAPALDSVLASLVRPLVERARDTACIEPIIVPDVVNMLTVCRYIDANLRNANLSPRYLAKALGCSVRHLHRLFDGSGTTVAAYIKQKRLQAVAADLRTNCDSADSITEIALRWGFPEFTHFSRSFRTEFGLSPRAFRSEVRGPLN